MSNGILLAVTHEYVCFCSIADDEVKRTRKYKFSKISVYSKQRLQKLIPSLQVYSQPVYIDRGIK